MTRRSGLIAELAATAARLIFSSARSALLQQGMKHQGNLTITAENAERYRTLTEVTGELCIYSGTKLDALTSVGGDLHIYSDAKLDAPALYAKGFSAFKVLDAIPCVVLSTKSRDEMTIMACRGAKILNQQIVGDKFFVAQRYGRNAHGKTIAEAVQELAFKTGSRDVSQYRNMPLTKSMKTADWAIAYRTVTGACQFGTQRFMEAQGKLKSKYTLAEILAMTKGQYGHETFAQVTTEAQR